MVSFRSSDAFVARWKQRQTMTKVRVLGCCGNFHGPAFASAVVGWFSCMTMQQACATSKKVFPACFFSGQLCCWQRHGELSAHTSARCPCLSMGSGSATRTSPGIAMEVIETQEPESVDLGNFILDAVDRNKICRLRCAKFSETSRSACRCVTCKSFKFIAACAGRGLQFSTISWIVACVTAWMTPLQVIDGRQICAKMHYLQCVFSRHEIFWTEVLSFSSARAWVRIVGSCGTTQQRGSRGRSRSGGWQRCTESRPHCGAFSRRALVQKTTAVHFDGIMGDGGPPIPASVPVANQLMERILHQLQRQRATMCRHI